MFYTYHQNNSWGKHEPPAINVIIEADSWQEANEYAEKYGLYFDGVYEGRDCGCCGDRWDPAWEEDPDTPVPLVYGHTPEQYVKDLGCSWGDEEIPEVLVVLKTGASKAYSA